MIFTDDINNTIRLDRPPRRIISLVPSLTELLFDLGLEKEIIGVTKFCVHPKNARQKCSIIGGTKKFDFEKIERLNPDLIIANKEENYKEGIERLNKDYPVYVSDIFNLGDALKTIDAIGRMTDRLNDSIDLINRIKIKFDQVKNIFRSRALYFIWQDPLMVAASENFIDYTLSWLGMENAAGHLKRYPELTEAELAGLSPDYVLLSSEPYPFKHKHLERFRQLFPKAEVLLVDGEMFSWYGSRLLKAPKYFASLPFSTFSPSE
ncbi:MAG: helical backbone metal receptor [Reichenbachiella sp.]|uniref:ABC transporter substrate-binding protein n=1 Tax=Reichenbachiella sp. TaxID=2184521 RepID=UPI003266121E